jgi:putative thiamine transport system ATP-binding protein
MLELIDVSIAASATAAGHASRVIVPPLSAQVQAGEVLVVMGDSGSGKSSLLAVLSGTLPAGLVASGQVRLDGRELSGLPTAQRRVGLLFQDDLLFPHMNVLDNLLFAVPAGDRAQRVAQAEAALAQADLAGFGPRFPNTLSGGQRARVSVLRALLAQPAALLLDEPFSRLDAALRERFRAFVFDRLRAQGVPAVLVTHDRQDVPPGARLLHLLPPEPGDA